MINDFAAYICTLYTQYSQDGLTPLHVVSDLRIAKFLMLNGAKVNMRDEVHRMKFLLPSYLCLELLYTQ